VHCVDHVCKEAAVQVVELWTGRHANALRNALRLTNEAFARKLGTATRTVAKWNAEPDLVPVAELQRALDTLLETAPEGAQLRFASLSTTAQTPSSKLTSDPTSAELRLTHDPALGQMLAWLDECAGWPPGGARQRVAEYGENIDRRELQDRGHSRGRVGQAAIAKALSEYYGFDDAEFHPYGAIVDGQSILTSILTRQSWQVSAIPLAVGRDNLTLDWKRQLPPMRLDDACAAAAAHRIAESLATDTHIVNTPLYRLVGVSINPDQINGTVALTDFNSYALTFDLMESELMDTIALSKPTRTGDLPLRDRWMPSLNAVTSLDQRLCAGGALALFAAARPAGRGRPRPDYVLLVQQRSARVLNAAQRLAVIPKAFHEPLSDFSDDARLSATLEREMEEELFGRTDVDSTNSEHRHADPLHVSRLSAPMRWLMDRVTQDPAPWRMECTGFGINLVSGNYKFANLIVVEDESWWTEYGGLIEANWESEGLHRYSSLDRDSVSHLVHDASWSNEGLFALLQGLHRLAQIGGNRVDLPHIELEADLG
jgi:hypothetical protein